MRTGAPQTPVPSQMPVSGASLRVAVHVFFWATGAQAVSALVQVESEMDLQKTAG